MSFVFDPNEDRAYTQFEAARQQQEGYYRRADQASAELLRANAAAYPHLKPGVVLSLSQAGIGPDHPAAMEAAQAQMRQQVKTSGLGWHNFGDLVSSPASWVHQAAHAITSIQKPIVRTGFTALESGMQEIQGQVRNLSSIHGGLGGLAAGGLIGAASGGGAPAAGIGAAVGGALGTVAELRGRVKGSADWGESQSTGGVALGALLSGDKVDLGSGWLPGGQVREEQVKRSQRVNIEGHSLTPGRLAASAIVEPGTAPYNMISGAVDTYAAIKGDPANIILSGVGKYRMAKRVLTPADAGAINGLRKTVDGDRVAKFLDSSEGTFLKNWLADQTDFDKIWRQSGKKFTVADADALSKLNDPQSVDIFLRDKLGTQYRMAPKIGRDPFKSATIRRVADARIFQSMPLKAIDPTDPDQAVEAIDRWLRNANIRDPEVIAKHTRAMAEATLNQDGAQVLNVAGAAAKTVEDVIVDSLLRGKKGIIPGLAPSEVLNEADRTKAFKTAVAQFGEDSAQAKAARDEVRKLANIKERARTLSTLYTDVGQRIRGWNIDDIGKDEWFPGVKLDANDMPLPSPHLVTEGLNHAVPLPRYADIRLATSRFAPIFENRAIKLGTMTTDWVTQNLWKPVTLLRGAWLLRVVGEEQLRMAAAGYQSFANHPMGAFAWVVADDGKLARAFKKINEGLGESFAERVGKGADDLLGREFNDLSHLGPNLTEYERAMYQGKVSNIRDNANKVYTHNVIRVEKGTGHDFLHRQFWGEELMRLGGDPIGRRVAQGGLDAGDNVGVYLGDNVLFRGVKSADQFTVDPQGNLHLHSTPDAGRVSFARARGTAADNAGTKAQGIVFEVDADHVGAGRMMSEAGDEIAAQGADDVVIPAGRWQVHQDSQARAKLGRWAGKQEAEIGKLTDEELAQKFRDSLAGQPGEVDAGVADATDIAAVYGDDPTDTFLRAEIARRVKEDPAALERMMAGAEVQEGTLFDTFGENLRAAAEGKGRVTPPTIPESEVYHGTSRPFEGGRLENRYFAGAGADNMFGPGVYVTDDPDVALSYTAKGRGPKKTVYGMRKVREMNFIDLERPLPEDAKAIFQRHIDESLPEDFTEETAEQLGDLMQSADATGSDVYRAIRQAWSEAELPKYEVDEALHALHDELIDAGYDGLRYQGGAYAGRGQGPMHNAYVVFEPENMEITHVTPGEGKVGPTGAGPVGAPEAPHVRAGRHQPPGTAPVTEEEVAQVADDVREGQERVGVLHSDVRIPDHILLQQLEGYEATLAKAKEIGRPEMIDAAQKLVDDFVAEARARRLAREGAEAGPRAAAPGTRAIGPGAPVSEQANRWRESVRVLDERGAPDSEYRSLLSTGSKEMGKPYKTWREKVLAFADQEEAKAAQIAGEGAGPTPLTAQAAEGGAQLPPAAQPPGGGVATMAASTPLAAPIQSQVFTRDGIDGIKDWFWNGPGQKFRQRVINMSRDYSTAPVTRDMADLYIDSVLERVARQTGDNPALRQAVVTGKLGEVNMRAGMGLNDEFIDALGDHVDSAPQWAHGNQTITVDSKSSELGARWSEVMNTAFSFLMGRPSNYLSRSPVFKQAYWKRVEELLPYMVPDVQAEAVRAARAAKLGKKAEQSMAATILRGEKTKKVLTALDQADVVAKGHALEATRDLLYDMSEKGQLFDQLRVIMPFGEAWKEVLTRWAKLAVERPQNVRRGQQAITAARGQVVGTQGKGFFHPDPTTGEEVFEYPGTGFLSEHLLGVRTPMVGRVAGLNMASSILPGVGPAVQYPAAAIIPNTPEWDDVREALLPFGRPQEPNEGFLESMLPPWVQRFNTAFRENNPEHNRMYANTMFDVARYLVSTGEYSTNSPEEVARLLQAAHKKAKAIYIFRGAAQFWAPSAPSPEMQAVDKDGHFQVAQTLVGDFKKMQDEDFDTAPSRFLDKYGDGAVLFMQPKTRGGGAATDEMDQWARSNPDLVKRYKDVYGFFAPQGGKFNFDLYNAQIERGEREPLTPAEAVEFANNRVGRMVYNQAKTKAGGRTDTPARMWLANIRQALIEEYPGYNPEGVSVNEAPVTISKLADAMKNPKMANTDAGAGIELYLQARKKADDYARNVLGLSGGYTSAKSALAVREWLRRVAEAIQAEHPDFSSVFDQVFDREMKNDTPEVIAV